MKCECGTELIHKEYKGLSVNASWDKCPKCNKEYNRKLVDKL